MLYLGKCFICPWKEWLFTCCWVQCSSHIIRSNWLIGLFNSPIPLLLLYLLTLPIIGRGMLLLGFVIVDLNRLTVSSQRPQILTLHIWANYSGELCAQLPPAEDPVQHPIPAALAASNFSLITPTQQDHCTLFGLSSPWDGLKSVPGQEAKMILELTSPVLRTAHGS